MSRMVHADARDWACECCVGGDDDCQQYKRFRGSNSALPVYINHLSGHALLSSYSLKASIFYYQKIANGDLCGLRDHLSSFTPKQKSRLSHVFSCQNFETFYTTREKKIAYKDGCPLVLCPGSKQHHYPRNFAKTTFWLTSASPARTTISSQTQQHRSYVSCWPALSQRSV